jgi:hypothetical protein
MTQRDAYMTRAEMIQIGFSEPPSAIVYAAMDDRDERMSRCICDWDGAPDTIQPRTPNPACPVHRDEDEEDMIEMERRTR